MPNQRGSLISGTTDPPYRFQPVNQRARSASGYVDDYYAEPDERSFVCSKPGFVCIAAVLFTVSFIALAFFVETGMEWRSRAPGNKTEPQVAAAGVPLPNLLKKSTNSVDSSEEDYDRKHHQKGPEVEDVKQERRPPTTPKATASRTISNFFSKVPNQHSLYIYTPFDDESRGQSHVIRFLLEALRFASNCFSNFTIQEAAQFFDVDTSSESEEKNIHTCQTLGEKGFANLRDHFGNYFSRNSKYLFIISDPRSLVYRAFDKHGAELENCHENQSHRCLYNEEILNNARITIEKWNTVVSQILDICEKLKRDGCRIIPIEKLIMKRKKTLDEIAQFLTMDENEDVHRMVEKMVRAVDDDSVNAATPKEKEMYNLLGLLVTDISNTWPWSGKLPFNFFEKLPTWAPLMGKVGYRFTSEPDMNLD